MFEARKEGCRAVIKYDKLFVDGRYFTLNELKETGTISRSTRERPRFRIGDRVRESRISLGEQQLREVRLKSPEDARVGGDEHIGPAVGVDYGGTISPVHGDAGSKGEDAVGRDPRGSTPAGGWSLVPGVRAERCRDSSSRRLSGGGSDTPLDERTCGGRNETGEPSGVRTRRTAAAVAGTGSGRLGAWLRRETTARSARTRNRRVNSQ
jgi:hypothetical protein